MKKKLTLLLTLGLIAALMPALAESGGYNESPSEEVTAQAKAAPAAVAEASEACAAEASEPFAAPTAAAALTAPDGPIFTTVLDLPPSSITITCDLCNTHADCQGICSGQPAVNFVCSRHFASCYGWGPKVCICF